MKLIMKKSILTLLLFLGYVGISMAQVGMNTDGSEPDGSAILDVKSDTKGLLPPRMTALQRDAISNPVEGLVIYNTESKIIELFNGTEWVTSTGQTLPQTDTFMLAKDSAAFNNNELQKDNKLRIPPK
jgi:hypothetical protein